MPANLAISLRKETAYIRGVGPSTKAEVTFIFIYLYTHFPQNYIIYFIFFTEQNGDLSLVGQT